MDKNKERQEIKITKLNRDYNFPPEVFIPLKTGTFLDNVTSKKGGTMPATINVIVGEPGTGKTTLSINKLTNIEVVNPTKKCLYISSEMSPIDNKELSDDLPLLNNVNTFYLSEYDDPKTAMEDVLDMGWDYVVIDSFMDVKDKVKDSDENKMTATAVETWLINLLVKNTKGQNNGNKFTSFDVIQHITKGGTYAGSTKLKHNTTSMMFLRLDLKTNERYMVYVKNRRGDINKKLYMNLVDGEILFDEIRYLELEEEFKAQIFQNNKQSEVELFENMGKINQ